MNSYLFENKSTISNELKREIRAIWNAEYPTTLAYNALGFDNYLAQLEHPSHMFVLNTERKVVGWLMVFTRDKERWFAMILNRQFQGKGIGSTLLQKAMQHEPVLNGWVIDSDGYRRADGSAYQSPLGFYKKQGFTIHPEVRLEIPKLSAVKISWRLQQ